MAQETKKQNPKEDKKAAVTNVKKAEEAVVIKEEEKVLAKEIAQDTLKETKTEHKEHEHKTESKSDKEKDAKDAKPVVKVIKTKKTEAVANGLSLHSSKKHAMYICNYIKGKKIDDAIRELGEVVTLKRAIPFKGEIPHRKGMMSGRYPKASSILFISLLKGLKGNAIDNQMDLDKTVIYYCSANWAFRPARSGGRMGKRCHVTLKAKEMEIKQENKK